MSVSNVGFYAGPLTLGAVNTPVSLLTLLAAVLSGVPTQLFIVPDGTAGNLVLTSNSAAAAESAGVPLESQVGFLSSSVSDPIQTSSMYLISATINKSFGVIARTR